MRTIRKSDGAALEIRMPGVLAFQPANGGGTTLMLDGGTTVDVTQDPKDFDFLSAGLYQTFSSLRIFCGAYSMLEAVSDGETVIHIGPHQISVAESLQKLVKKFSQY